MLANIGLDDLKSAIDEALPQTKTGRQQTKVHLVRYADDFFVTGADREILVRQVRPAVESFLGSSAESVGGFQDL